MIKLNMENEANNIVSWIKDWVNSSGNEQTKVVIGISGGKDSTACAYACVKALGKDRVVGVLMPKGSQLDIDDSWRVVTDLGIEHYVVNIGETYESLTRKIVSTMHKDESYQYYTNTPARIRMATLYGVAAILGNARVINTCNFSEDLVGYSTLYGDSAGDFSPLGKLYVDEVMELCDVLGVPEELGHKTPSDGMCGKSDEDNLGFTYAEIKQVYNNEYDDNITIEKAETIRKKIDSFAWKRNIQNIPTYKPLRLEAQD